MNPFAGMNLASLLEARASERGTHPLLVWAPLEGPPRTWSYAGFAAEVASVAGGLLRRGVRPGDRVLVQLENCPEALMVRHHPQWLRVRALLRDGAIGSLRAVQGTYSYGIHEPTNIRNQAAIGGGGPVWQEF